MKGYRRVLGALILGIAGCAPETPPASTGSLESVKKDVASGTAVIVDVRSRVEWDGGHLDQAIFVPLSDLMKDAKEEGFAGKIAEKIPKGKIVYTH